MLFEEAVITGPVGFRPTTESAVCKNLSGGTLSRGEVVALDLAGTQAETAGSGESLTWADPASSSDPGSRYAGAVVGSVSNNVDHGTFGVVLKGGADNENVTVALSGEVWALVQKNSLDIAEGDPLVASATQKYLEADIGSGSRIIGKCLDYVPTPSTAVLALVLFEGRLRGFGVS